MALDAGRLAAEVGSLLFTHSSRRRFAARLNSGVRPHMMQSSFLQEVAIALAGCQEVELMLKVYIRKARAERGDPTGHRISERPLGPLIKDFRKLSNNKGLATRLDQFREKRNNLVHNAISACIVEDDDDGVLDEQKIAASFLSLKTLQLDAHDLRNDIAAAHAKLFKIYGNIPIPPDAV